MRLLRIHGSSFNIFSAEKDGPYSQAIRACLEPPIAWYQAGTRVQDELLDYQISATACRAHTVHRLPPACSGFAVRPFRRNRALPSFFALTNASAAPFGRMKSSGSLSKTIP